MRILPSTVMLPVPLLAALLASACGAAPTALSADLQRRLDESQRRAGIAERKLDELENRVFLLTDQVESQKVATLRRDAPRLPVVTLRPEEPGETAASGEEVATADIVFEGAARSGDPTHVRPQLQLEERRPAPASPRRRSVAAAPVVSAPEPSGRGPAENLGVAPVPPIQSARRSSAPSSMEHRASPAQRGLGAEGAPPSAEPLSLYRVAYAALQAGHHDEAVAGFRALVRRFPHHDYADNAQYWLGECFYDRKRYREAAAEFRTVVSRFPSGNKAPDAMLKLAFSLLGAGQQGEARDLLAQLPDAYPRTEAARLAAQKLNDLDGGAAMQPTARLEAAP